MKRTSGIALFVAGLALAAGTAQAQPGAAPAAVAPADGRAVVAALRKVLTENYVLPDVRPKLDAALAKGLAAGRYDVSDPAMLVERVNADLAAVTPDKHLGMHYDPPGRGRGPAVAAPRGDDGPPTPEAIRQAQQRNHGFVEMKVLSATSATSNMQGFVWTGPKSAAAYDNAMRFLKRRRRGDHRPQAQWRRQPRGRPVSGQPLHGAEPAARHLPYGRRTRSTSWRPWRTLPAGRMVGKPLYVLTSGRYGQRRRGIHRPCRRLQARRDDRRDDGRSGLPQHLLPSARRLSGQRLGRPGGARLDRQGLGGGRDRAGHGGRPGQGAGSRPGPCAAQARRHRLAARQGALRGGGGRARRPGSSRWPRRFRSPPMPARSGSARCGSRRGVSPSSARAGRSSPWSRSGRTSSPSRTIR